MIRKTFFKEMKWDLFDIGEKVFTILQGSANSWSIHNDTDVEISVLLIEPTLNHINQSITTMWNYKASEFEAPVPKKKLITKISAGQVFFYEGDSLPTQKFLAGTKIILETEEPPTTGKVKLFYSC